MVNLLYVTREILQKIKQHKSYYFWLPIVQNFPIKNIPIEERSFHPRNVEVKNGFIYLTVDMKFVYARDNMFSFLYENQDLSYRFSAYQGILRTLDNKQFSALIGQVAKVVASTDVELVNTDKVYHPLFDSGVYSSGTSLNEVKMNNIENNGNSDAGPTQTSSADIMKPKRKRGRPRKNPLPEEQVEKSASEKSVQEKPKKRGRKPAALKNANEPPTVSSDGEKLLLGKYAKNICDEIYNFRKTTQENYEFLSTKFGIEKSELRKIVKLYRKGKVEL